jgi:RHS repeat-associated protein
VVLDTFGGIVSESNVTNGDRYKYASREYNRASLSYYYRGRIYSPEPGRLQSEDPLGLSVGANLYRFEENDPVNNRDPSGLAQELKVPSWWTDTSWKQNETKIDYFAGQRTAFVRKNPILGDPEGFLTATIRLISFRLYSQAPRKYLGIREAFEIQVTYDTWNRIPCHLQNDKPGPDPRGEIHLEEIRAGRQRFVFQTPKKSDIKVVTRFGKQEHVARPGAKKTTSSTATFTWSEAVPLAGSPQLRRIIKPKTTIGPNQIGLSIEIDGKPSGYVGMWWKVEGMTYGADGLLASYRAYVRLEQ